MNKIVLIFIVFVLLVLGGAAFWKFGMPLISPLENETAEEQVEEEPELRSNPLFVTLDPIVIPIVKEGVVTEQLALALQLEVPNLTADNTLNLNLPRLLDGFVSELYSLYSLRYVREHRDDLVFIKKRLQQVADRTLGKGVVSNILVVGAEVQQPSRAGRG